MEMMVSDGTANLANLRTAVPSAPCQDSAAAAPINADLMKSTAVQYNEEVFDGLQLNIFSQDSRHFDIVSENGDISYHLHKVRTFSPFAASEWQLSDGSKRSPGTIIIRKSPFAGHVTFERKDGTLIADMGPRLLMTGSEFCWGGKVYRWQTSSLSVPLKMCLMEMGTRQEMAHLQGSWVWPWSVKQDHITLVGEMRESMWVRIVIASGMSEASSVFCPVWRKERMLRLEMGNLKDSRLGSSCDTAHLQRSQVRAPHETNVIASSPTFRAYRSQGSRRPVNRPAHSTASDTSADNWKQSLPQHAAAAGAAALLLLSTPLTAEAKDPDAKRTYGQGDLLTELLQKNAGTGIKGLGPSAQKTFKDMTQNTVVSEVSNQAQTLTSSDATTNADNPIDKAAGQVKSFGKKVQQGTPKGSPTKPQPIQRSGPLEAVTDTAKSGLQVATTEGAFKLQGPITRGATQGLDFPSPQGAKEAVQAKKGRFFQSAPKSTGTNKASPQEVAKAAGDKAAESSPAGNPLTKLLGKPDQALEVAKATAPSGNPPTKLLGKPDQAKEAAKEAAPSGNPLNSLLTKPKQAADKAASKSNEAARSATKSSLSSNPLSGLLSKPKQAADKGKGESQQAAGGAAVAGAAVAAAAAAANAVKSVPEAPSLPSPPSLPNPTEALKSTSDAASKLSLPEAPSVTSVGQDSSALQQAIGLAAAETIAALITINISSGVGSGVAGRNRNLLARELRWICWWVTCGSR
ncbi:hypothetical protein WJX82_001169 [Trebouxia sp. C0006]